MSFRHTVVPVLSDLHVQLVNCCVFCSEPVCQQCDPQSQRPSTDGKNIVFPIDARNYSLMQLTYVAVYNPSSVDYKDDCGLQR